MVFLKSPRLPLEWNLAEGLAEIPAAHEMGDSIAKVVPEHPGHAVLPELGEMEVFVFGDAGIHLTAIECPAYSEILEPEFFGSQCPRRTAKSIPSRRFRS